MLSTSKAAAEALGAIGLSQTIAAMQTHQDDAICATSPIDGDILAYVPRTSTDELNHVAQRAHDVFASFRDMPAPLRGDVVREFGQALRAAKPHLSLLVSIEAGKIQSEAEGEVQEMIDVCDFAVGLSRQLYGRTMPSERPGHHLIERWCPLGPTAIISAFNFPVAVWAWNTAIALVCGNPVVWKPSERTTLTAIASAHLLHQVLVSKGLNTDISQLVQGGVSTAQSFAADARYPLVSVTGSTEAGRALAPIIAARFGKGIYELGGNNATIVTPSADLQLAVRGCAFSAAGTAGQRCTTLRRLLVHESRVEEMVSSLSRVFEQLTVGDPRDPNTHVGPLIEQPTFMRMKAAIQQAIEQGGTHITGGEQLKRVGDGVYVSPAIVQLPHQTDIAKQETFAPLLYVIPYQELSDALDMLRGVAHGLSSSIFTTDVRESEYFLSAAGSDCGIANVNIGPSGAEIGGAFGGEKDTGGGRESGSDSWKQYMRRQTQTINYSSDLPLAQGVKFDV